MTIVETINDPARAATMRPASANAAIIAAAIRRNRVRKPRPRDAPCGGDAGAVCRAPPPPTSGGLISAFARFRFLAKMISEAEPDRAQRRSATAAPTVPSPRLRRAYCTRHPARPV